MCATARVLGAIGVIELEDLVPRSLRQRLIEKGVWIRPFGNIIYTPPPLMIPDADLAVLIEAMVSVVREAR